MSLEQIDRLMGWHLLIAPEPGRRVYLEGFPGGAARHWTDTRGETVVGTPGSADLVISNAAGRIHATTGDPIGATALRRYALVPPADPRLVLPLDNLAQVRRGLSLHRPGRRSARIAAIMLSILARMGVTSPLARNMLTVDCNLQPAIHVDPEAVLYLGAVGECRKTTILPAHGPYILKHACTAAAKTALHTEAETLQLLRDTSVADRIPQQVVLHEDSAGYVLQQEYRSRTWMKQQELTHEVVRFLCDLARIGPDIRGGVPGHRCHGDFAPWNVLPTRKGIFVFDWEDSREWAPALSDAFYFSVAPFLHIEGHLSAAGVVSRAHRLAGLVAQETGLSVMDVQTLWHKWLGENRSTTHPGLARKFIELEQVS